MDIGQDRDEDALEAIRRRLDLEFPHAKAPAATEQPGPRRRGRAAAVLGLLLPCAGGAAAGALFVGLYSSPRPPAVDETVASPATTAIAPVVRAPSPTTPPPPRRAEPRTRPPGLQREIPAPVSSVPDVTPVAETLRADTAAPVVAPPPSPAVPPPVERDAEPAAPLVHSASVTLQPAGEAVKEDVARGRPVGPEAP